MEEYAISIKYSSKNEIGLYTLAYHRRLHISIILTTSIISRLELKTPSFTVHSQAVMNKI